MMTRDFELMAHADGVHEATIVPCAVATDDGDTTLGAMVMPSRARCGEWQAARRTMHAGDVMLRMVVDDVAHET